MQPKDSVYALIRNEAINAGIDKTFLDKTFNHKDIKVHSKIKELFEKPYEKKSWAEYRKIFVVIYLGSWVAIFLRKWPIRFVPGGWAGFSVSTKKLHGSGDKEKLE